MRKKWTRNQQIAVWAVAAAVVGILSTLFRSEIRQFFHLERPQIAEIQPIHRSAPPVQNTGPAKPEQQKTKEAPKTKTHVTGNENVTDNNISGDNNVTGNNNQTRATANAPNGIAIAGGTVIQPTVNNYTPPNRRLSDDQKAMLKACLAVKTGTFTISAIANNSEAYQYAKYFSDVFSDAGWKNEQPIPVAIIMIAGGMWSGVRISVHGTWNEATKTASLIDGAPETLGLECLLAAKFGATAIPWADMKTGSIRIDVSERPQ